MTHQTSAQARIPAKRGRFDQANREARITLGLYLGYFVWWYACAYGLGSGDPGEYSYVWGFPAWFFYSCIVGYPLISLALWLAVRLFFRDMPLDEHPGANPGAFDSAQAADSSNR